ncbi:Zinc finger, PHD-type [Corchorus olitorius]|uniref:Zinc finger, PHD-type n=1 Tax=Corchorus olitorius TaxID=93759 RepID=A0A1R3G399_9ROSI|nr:Zinc finger, PHD-type [Corchorus olitorius]
MEGYIDHFLHEHPLMLIEDTKECNEFLCHECRKSISPGPIYGCALCLFYICAEHLPKEIQHFSHLCPLFLNKSSFGCNACLEYGHDTLSYGCKRCYFNMHVECAQRLNMTSNGDNEEIIQHFTHWHQLKLVDEDLKKDLQVGCGICKKLIRFDSAAAAAYGCEICNFFFHKSCMINIPRQINNHLLHPSCPLILVICSSYECKGCDDRRDDLGLVFRCEKCKFELDVRCALHLPSYQSKDAIQYAAHKHPLVPLPDIIASEVDHRCGACGEKWSLELELDEDPGFGCKRCHLFLHKSCMLNIPQQINHLFHPSCPLTLLTPSSSYRCAGCDDKHVSGLAYCCEKCGFQMDMKCTFLPTLDQSKDADKIQHVAHKHPLLAHDHHNKGNIIASDVDRCRVCGEKCQLESWVGCERCQFFMHKRCAIEFTVEAEIQHYFHPLHPLTLSSPPTVESTTTSECGSCLGSIDEFLLVYRCAKCNFNLHLDCAKPKRQLLVRCEGHSHDLTFFDKTSAATLCHICHKVARNCIFRCVACDFNIHLYCHPSAPKTILKPNCHLHPLTLTESPFQYELISPEYQEESDDEFYCDVCEGKRDKYESVYYCAECKRIAETRCVISELLPSVIGSEDHGGVIFTDGDNSALEASIAERTMEMEELTANKKVLELEIVKLKALEEELKSINQKLEEFERDRFLWNYQLNHSKEKKFKWSFNFIRAGCR